MLYTLSIDKEKIRSFLYHNKSILTNGIFHLDFIPNKKVINATKVYNVDYNHVIALYDTTFLKSGKDGLLICDNFIGVKHSFCSADKISYEDLVTGGIDDEKKTIMVNNTSIHLSRDEFVKLFMKLKVFLILEDSTLKNTYETYINNSLNDIKLKIKNNTYTNLEEEFLILNKVVIKQYNIRIDTILYYLGCLIYLEKFDFKEVDKYYLKLKELNQLSKDIMSKLKEDIEKRKLQYEFNLLVNEKNRLIQDHKYDDAIIVVNKQKLLKIRTLQELDGEIIRINALKESYIKSLEKRVEETLLNNDYKGTFTALNTLKEINPNKSYAKDYVMAEIGVFNFLSAMINIQDIAKNDADLANELKEKLQTGKNKATEAIKEAVENKNYNFFKENPSLKSFKDNWGMCPLMHFVVKEDLDGIKFLKDTFDISDRNIVGHTTLNLVTLSESYKFKSEAFRILDDNLDAMLKKFKTKNTIGKFKKLALNGGEILNNSAIIRYDIKEATASYEKSINQSIEDIEHEIHLYLDTLIATNTKEFKELIINPRGYTNELNRLKELKDHVISEIDTIKDEEERIKHSLEDRLSEVLNKNLDNYIIEAANIEIGEKDEFEKTVDYENRKTLKIEEIKKAYKENNYIKEKIANLKIQITKNIDENIKELQSTINNKYNELTKLDDKIKECSYLIDCETVMDINEVFNYYYEKYKKGVDIGVYNADLEVFSGKIYEKELQIPVPLNIAREFKENFKNLNTRYEKIVSEENGEYKIEHIFVYEFKEEQVKIPFLKS